MRGAWKQTRGEATTNVIESRGIEKAYRVGNRTLEVLRGVDLDVRKGESLAILGPSGSGKSTLLHILGGLDRPDRGEVTIDGVPLASLDGNGLSELRLQRVGFVFQLYNLLPALTTRANVELPLLLADEPDQEVHATAEEMLRLVELEDRGDHYPPELSGGEQQRAAIARALVGNPSVVMADEPTGNLDAETALRILALIKRLQRDLGQTLVVVTHDHSVAESCNQILYLNDGVLRSRGGRTE